MKNIFTDHPHSVGETYFQHFIFASKFGLGMMFAGCACVLHAIFPFVCKKTASNLLLKMTTNYISRMPVLDENVIAIGSIIDKKRGQSQSSRLPISTSMMQMDYDYTQRSEN